MTTQHPKLDVRRIRRLFDEGLTDDQIGEVMSVHPVTIGRHTRWMRAEVSYKNRTKARRIKSKKSLNEMDVLDYINYPSRYKLHAFIAASGASFE